MTGAPELRQGHVADLAEVMRVMERAFDPAFGEAWNRAQCLGILALADVWLTLAERREPAGARTIGFALGRLLVDDAELLLLAVDPVARGCGVGAALVERTAAIGAGGGARRLLLEMRDGNPAHRLYDACGFATIGRRRGYYRGADGGSYDALTLARPLGESFLRPVNVGRGAP